MQPARHAGEGLLGDVLRESGSEVMTYAIRTASGTLGSYNSARSFGSSRRPSATVALLLPSPPT
jgi:hypothetical protein